MALERIEVERNSSVVSSSPIVSFELAPRGAYNAPLFAPATNVGSRLRSFELGKKVNLIDAGVAEPESLRSDAPLSRCRSRFEITCEEQHLYEKVELMRRTARWAGTVA